MKLTHPTSLANFSHLITSNEEEVFFSYETPIALFQPDGEIPLIVKNEWGPTTGRHINRVKREVIGDFHEVSHEFLMSCLKHI